MTHLLFDIDGVLLKAPPRLFSAHVAEKYGLPEALIQRFFSGIFHQCLRGEIDIREALAPELPMWGYPGTVDDFLQEWFHEDFVLNEDLLQVVQHLNASGYTCHLATNQEKHRAAYLWERFKDHFVGMFASSHLGAKKPEPEYFQKVREKLPDGEIYFWDDQPKNVEAAQEAGWKAFVYLSEKAVLEVLQSK